MESVPATDQVTAKLTVVDQGANKAFLLQHGECVQSLALGHVI